MPWTLPASPLGRLACRRVSPRRQLLELPTQRPALGQVGCKRGLVSLVVALEKTAARGPKTLPDHVGATPAHRPHGVPFRLKPPNFRHRGLPVRRLRQPFCPRAQLFLVLKVSGPFFLAAN